MKKILIPAILIILAGLAWNAGWFAKAPQVQPTPLPEGIVLFWGEGCPHCKNVEDFLIQNKVDEKLKITRLELPFAGKTSPELENNAALALQLAEKCKIESSSGMSIPFMYDGEKCYIGDVDAINFFKEKAGTQ